MNRLLTLYTVLFVGCSFGQQLVPTSYDTLETRNHEINLSGIGDFGSATISNKLANRLVFGGEITDAMINQSMSKQKTLNRLGYIMQPALEYVNYKVQPFKTKNWGLYFRAEMLYTGSGRYREGLFGLMFRGNEPYLGSSIDLSNMVVTNIGMHKIGFGFIDAKSKSSVSLNLYGITNYFGGYLNETTFSQDETGFNAALQIDGQLDATTSGAIYKGFGVGFDANLYFKVGNPEKPAFLQFTIRNLGFGYMNNTIVRNAIDTTILHDGYTIANITNGETIFGKDKNVAEELGLRSDTISKTIALPFTVQLGKIIDEHNTKKIQFFYGTYVNVQHASLPLVYGGIHYRSQKWFRMGLGISYGGFAGFRTNFYLQGNWNNFNIGIATNDLLGIAGIGRGNSCTFNLSYRFKNN